MCAINVFMTKNKDTKIIPVNSPDTAASAEELHRPLRFLVYGTRIAGVFDLSALLNAALEDAGIDDAQVHACRSIANIDDAFFDRNHALPPEQPSRPALALDAGRVLLQRIRQAVAGDGAGSERMPQLQEEARLQTSIPSAVFVFPEMRADFGAMRGDVDTPYDHIDALCEEYGVPVIRVERTSKPDEIDQQIRQITSPE